jgi:RNA polymerase sigma factor (sigma-70 family)
VENHAERAGSDPVAPEHFHLVDVIAANLKRRLPESIDMRDLQAQGILGLLAAARCFDPSRDVPFAAYAKKWIRGSMLHFVGGRDGSRFCEHKHAPLDFDLPDHRQQSPERAAIAAEQRVRLDRAIARLKPRRRAIIELLYRDGLRRPEVAARLGISLRAATNLRFRALADLRMLLATKKSSRFSAER